MVEILENCTLRPLKKGICNMFWFNFFGIERYITGSLKSCLDISEILHIETQKIQVERYCYEYLNLSSTIHILFKPTKYMSVNS